MTKSTTEFTNTFSLFKALGPERKDVLVLVNHDPQSTKEINPVHEVSRGVKGHERL